jgi:hypothetical protein
VPPLLQGQSISSDALMPSDFGNITDSGDEDDPSLKLRHDDLRKFQVSQPLYPTKPKWPAMEDWLKEAFKSNYQAVRLLRYFGYAKDSTW